MIEPITTTIEVTINLCNWENSLPEVFSDEEPNFLYDYCDFEAQIEKANEIAKRISKGPLKLSNEQWAEVTDAVLRNFD